MEPSNSSDEYTPPASQKGPRRWLPLVRWILWPAVLIAGIVWALVFIQGRLDSGQEGVPDLSIVLLEEQGITLGAASEAPPPEIGEPAPDFTLVDLAGEPITLSSMKGRTVLINFWATWCAPCRKEMPDMNSLYLEMKTEGFEILAINLQEGRGKAKAFADDFGLAFPILLDLKGDVGSTYRLTGLPESWFVDRNGILQERAIGPMDEEMMREKLEITMRAVPPEAS